MFYLRIRRRCAPLMVALLLLAVAAVCYAYKRRLDRTSKTVSEPSIVDVEAYPVANMEAVTDRGTHIPLFQIHFLTPAEEVRRFERELQAMQLNAVRLEEPGSECNCHGWVFTAGQYSLRDFDIRMILRDNGYQEVAQPAPGDLIVYGNDAGLAHTGLVRRVSEDGGVMIESKWGPFGLYEHAPLDQPYAADYRYFRSQRGTHLLRFRWQVSISHASQ